MKIFRFESGQWVVPQFLVLLALSASAASNAPPEVCRLILSSESPRGVLKESLGFDVRALQAEIEKKVAPRSLYQPILSTDVDFIRAEAIFAEGPAPQRNMRILDPRQQFRFNAEAKAVFELKKKVVRTYPKKTLGVMRGQAQPVKEAVQEQFAMILEEFPQTRPDLFRREGEDLINLLTGDRLSLRGFRGLSAQESLERLGEFIPDDLIFMKKFGSEYRLIGGNLAFPTHWDIESFLGKTITEIHENLTGTPQSNAVFSKMINGVLDRSMASTQIVCRNNWFLELDPRYPIPGYQRSAYPGVFRITKQNYLKSTFLRTERQGIRGLPRSKTAVFSIQPMVFPLASVIEDRHVAEQLVAGIGVKLPNDAFAVRIAKYLKEDLASKFPSVRTQVVGLQEISDATYAVSLERPRGLKLFAGEAVRVTLDTPQGRQTRTLSLASSPDADVLEFAVRDTGSGFKAAFKALTPGTPVQLELMRTNLNFRTDRPAVMIAGGIGITPFRSFIQYAKERNLDTPMWLFYGNRDGVAFKAELDGAARTNSNLQVTHVLSQAGPEWEGTRGRIDKAFLREAVKEVPSDAIYYVVASPQMTDDVKAALMEFGIPEERISTESFAGYGGSGGKGGNAAIDAKTARDCQTVCYCRRVNAGQIRSSIDQGAATLEAIQAATGASTACGGCATNVLGFLQCAAREVK